MPQKDIELIKYVCYRACGVCVTYKCQHKITALKEDGQEDLSSLSSFNRVHFNHCNIRVGCDICLIILVSTTNITLFVDPYRFLLFSYR